jgi:type I restriction enzyme S subunit
MNAVHQLLTNHIDIWTAADTAKKSGRGRTAGNAGDVYGIKKMRELILELAVRGKLVPQDPKNEPASELLERIQAEKTNLIAENKIKKNKSLPPITEEEKPFKVPQGWEQVRFGEIIELVSGQHLNPGEYFENPKNGSIPYITGPADFGDEGPLPARHTCERRAISIRGDILVTVKGSGVGKTNTVSQKELAISRQLMAVRPIIVDVNYIEIVLVTLAKLFQELTVGIAIPGISREDILHSVIEIPPLTEQHRIVAKVDELMKLCGQLEAQHTNAFDAHEKLVSHLLGTLTRSQDAEDFSANWQRIAAHFDTLFTTETSIDTLKQTLLQLAVMGKLVPQNQNDEPASELLERIQAEKAKLIAEGKIKKCKQLSPIADDDKPFELPAGWAWARFPELGEFGRGKSKHRPRNDPKLFNSGIYPLVQTGEVARADNVIGEYHSQYSDIGLAQSKMWPAGTLCITIAANIADSALLGFNACFPDSIVGFVPCKPLNDSRYLLTFMKTARDNLLRFAPATAQKNINLEILESILIPLPPLKEISRIVAKVDELTVLCDKLKTRITEANQLQQTLADAIVEQAVA